MRILHFSDLHIGVENYGRTDPATGLSTRLGDFLDALDELVEFALANRVDIVLLAGDAYKGRDPSQTHQRALARRLRRLSDAGIPVFLLAGNHDLPAAASRANAVEIYATLGVPNVYVGDRLTNYAVSTPAGPLQILAVPWPSRGSMLARDESRGLSIEQIRQEVERRMTETIAHRAGALDADTPAILAGHLTVTGATVGTERSMMLGSDHILNVSALRQPQLEYVALGHIHKHQVLHPPAIPGNGNGSGSRNGAADAIGPAAAYSGSLQRVDFTEEDDDKGFCLIDLDPAAPQGRRLTDFRFEKIAARPFLTVAADLPENEENPTDFVARAISRRPVAGAIVRVRLRLSGRQNALLREADLRAALSPAHYIAAIERTITDEPRRRLDAEPSDLEPMAALRLYLQSRGASSERQQAMLARAEELLAAARGAE